MESVCDSNDYKLREEDLYTFLEGRSGYNVLEETNIIKVVVIEVDRELYDTYDRIKTEDLIRKMLVEANREDDMDRLYK